MSNPWQLSQTGAQSAITLWQLSQTHCGPRLAVSARASHARTTLFGFDVSLARGGYSAERGYEVNAWESTYLHVLKDKGEDPVFDWISGTGARPFLEALPDELRDEFGQELKRRLRAAYPAREWGTVLPYRRTFAVAPSTTVEMQIRVGFYQKVQHLPVTFHDGWGSGQLLSRMMGDINTIRRWIAFGMIMAVTVVVTDAARRAAARHSP